ncbi:MAG: F0F1 ATP synthase subunit B [Bacteroidales bacterium]|nr:F0F1 ATP synthase subunit B [Bacteroidales bacterium]
MNLITPDSGLVVWMTIIFAIVFFILAKYGFPVITSMVKKRNDKIHDSLAAARLAEEKLATLAQQQQELLEKARVEQAALLKDAAAARDNLIAQAKQQAKEEADKIIQNARLEIAAEREDALRDVRRQVAEISLDVAEKVIRKTLQDTGEQAQLVDRLVEEATRTRPES